MRTLGDIIEAVKDNEAATTEELRYSVLALSALHYFARASVQRLHEHPNSKIITPQGEFEDGWNRDKAALAKDPKSFVGWNNDPANGDYQRFRAMGKKLINKLVVPESPAPATGGGE